MSEAPRDQNFVPAALGQSSASATTTLPFKIDSSTGRLLVDVAGGSGTVTIVSVTSANGFAGTVATATTTPAITISTSINAPILAGNGTALIAATTTGSGTTAVLATAPVFPTTITVGAQGGATGSVLLKGTTSGTVTLKTADAAGTWTFTLPVIDGDAGQVLSTDGSGITSWISAGAGTVTAVSVATANGVSGSSSGGATPALTIVLGEITPTTVNGNTFTAGTYTLTGTAAKTLTFSNSLTLAGTDGTVMTFPTTSATIARTDAANTFTGIQSMTSPAITTSITTPTASFTALAGATTLLTLGGTGASASVFMPSTLDTTSSTTGAIRTSGGISAAKALNIGTSATIGTTIELGDASDTTLSRSAAGVLAVEGVRVQTTTPLIVSAASYTTDTGTSLNMDNLDEFIITAQAGALLFNSPGGTLVQGRPLIIRIKDNGTARALTWNGVFRAMGTALPSTTVLSKTLYLGFKYNTTDTKWDLIASAQEA